MKLKITALILALVLIIGCFAGCGSDAASSSAGSQQTGSADSAGSADSSTGSDSADVSQPSETTYSTFDYETAYAAYAPDTVVLTVNGHEITWDEYFGWIFTIVSEMEMYLGTAFGWDDMFSEEYTFGGYVQYYAQAMSAQYSIIYNKAMDLGFELTEEELQVIDEAFASDAESYSGGDMDAFAEYLESTYMSKDYYYYINTVATFYQRIYESIYGENGVNFTDEEVARFIEDNGYLYAKHILFKTVDNAGTPYDEETIAEKKAAAEDTLVQLNAITDTQELLTKFDELMTALTEDTGIISYPDGYYFQPGEMVQQFEDGTKALDYYGVSGIVETDYGYHIILRLPIEPDALIDGTNSFRYVASTYAYDDLAKEWFDSAEIVYTEQFQTIDFSQLLTLKDVTVTQ